MNGTHIGTAYAWNRGDEWFFCRDAGKAPDDAVEVRSDYVDGRLILHHRAGGTGIYIRGATLVD